MVSSLSHGLPLDNSYHPTHNRLCRVLLPREEVGLMHRVFEADRVAWPGIVPPGSSMINEAKCTRAFLQSLGTSVAPCVVRVVRVRPFFLCRVRPHSPSGGWFTTLAIGSSDPWTISQCKALTDVIRTGIRQVWYWRAFAPWNQHPIKRINETVKLWVAA